MRYVSINSVPSGSTGAVMRQVTEERLALGDECWCMWGRGRAAENDHEFNFGNKLELYLDVLQTRFDGRAGFHSKMVTRRLLRKLDEIQPDVVHLHNVHGYYVNVEMLFDWLAKHEKVQVRWTLHDCWAFTGHCAHFQYVDCERWKEGTCGVHCPQLGTYPKTLSSSSCAWNYKKKRKTFTRLPGERLTLSTPSHWLEELVKESFLAKYSVEVRKNTVDTSIFKPTPSDCRERYNIGNRFMILGVASPWTERKGLEDFITLSRMLDPKTSVVVLVGLSSKQIKSLPETIIGLKRTDSAQELAGLYTTADLFINFTKEDNYPTVNLEAEACGTPVLTANVGGCSETINDMQSHVFSSFEEALERLNEYIDMSE